MATPDIPCKYIPKRRFRPLCLHLLIQIKKHFNPQTSCLAKIHRINSDWKKAQVYRSTGSWYTLKNEEGVFLEARLRGKIRQLNIKATNPIAVGDWVYYLPDPENAQLALIDDLAERENYIIRQSVHKKHQAHILAANINQVVIIASLVFPKTSLGFIDRMLVSAESFEIPAVVVLNKVDLLDHDTEAMNYVANLVKLYNSLGYHCLMASAKSMLGIQEFHNQIEGKTSLICGHSGVGKSTLVNLVAPELNLRTGEVSEYAEKGTHTTTFAEMFDLNENSRIIDTPGIKELGILGIEDNELSHFFPELRMAFGKCKFYNCKHINEPNCIVKDWLETGEISVSRYKSYLSMYYGEDTHH